MESEVIIWPKKKLKQMHIDADGFKKNKNQLVPRGRG
jgi:hypothetical protein